MRRLSVHDGGGDELSDVEHSADGCVRSDVVGDSTHVQRIESERSLQRSVLVLLQWAVDGLRGHFVDQFESGRHVIITVQVELALVLWGWWVPGGVRAWVER